MSGTIPHIIMPVKDSISMAERAIRTIVATGHSLTVYDDNSTSENAARLNELSVELGVTLIPLSALTDHPSPNYRTILIHAREAALEANTSLMIIESDVIVKADTIDRLTNEIQTDTGLVAAITVDEKGVVNYPYTEGKKHLSFCCTLLTNQLLQRCDFQQILNPEKNWFDVTISHYSEEHGLRNILLHDCTVTHYPHSSRPWKQLKYTNPLLYYWRKITQQKDKI